MTILMTIILGVISSLIADGISKSLVKRKQSMRQGNDHPNEINWDSLRRKIGITGLVAGVVFGVTWVVLMVGPELGYFKEYPSERAVSGWITLIACSLGGGLYEM